MWHVNILTQQESTNGDSGRLMQKATGSFYTDLRLADDLASQLVSFLSDAKTSGELAIADPFCGDGRLIIAFLRALHRSNYPILKIKIALWDIDPKAVDLAQQNVCQVSSELEIQVEIDAQSRDAFALIQAYPGYFDCIITNPPWDVLKPDPRDIGELSSELSLEYVKQLRSYDKLLASYYPRSQPKRKFAGWGTNLARVGLEASLKLLRPHGLLGIVSPASVLADDISAALRIWLFTEKRLRTASYYPAEARLYGKADIESCTLVVQNEPAQRSQSFLLRQYGKNLQPMGENEILIDDLGNEYRLSLKHGIKSVALSKLTKHLRCFHDLEGQAHSNLWAGRELDESQLPTKLGGNGVNLFVKGRMIDRYEIAVSPHESVKAEFSRFESCKFQRIVWRDVARSSQHRRMRATLIPSGWIAGNSLNVAYFRNGDKYKTLALLGILNSVAFEWQLRSLLSTGHISLSAVRQVKIPELSPSPLMDAIVDCVQLRLRGQQAIDLRLEALVARAYCLPAEILENIIGQINVIPEKDRHKILDEFSVASECQARSNPMPQQFALI